MRFAAPLLLTISLLAFAQESALIQLVPPDFGLDAGKPKLTLSATVDFAILPDGSPYTANARGMALPLPVVRALAKSRFRPAEKAYGVALNLEIPYLIETYGGARRTPATLSPEILKQADSLKAPKALEVEGKLKSNADSVTARSALIFFAASQNDPQILAMRERQIAWLVENQPLAEVLRTPTATLSKANSPAAYATIKGLWMERLAKTPDQFEILEAASTFMRLSDPDEVQRILRPYSRSASVQAWLGEAYALGSIGMQNIGIEGAAPTSAGTTLPQTPAAVAARAALISSSDLPVLTSAMFTLLTSVDSLVRFYTKLPGGFEEFCDAVRTRIRELKPNFADGCPLASYAPNPEASGKVSKGFITKQVPPVYPPEAKAKGIGGMVVLSCTIGKDGKMQRVDFLKGPLLLFEAAVAAVRQWEYRPYKLGNEPVEVVAEIEVNFALR